MRVLAERAVQVAFRVAVQGGWARLVTPKGIGPTEEELAENPRASSARLRVAEVTVEGAEGRGTRLVAGLGR